jgi:hypothetical protein
VVRLAAEVATSRHIRDVGYREDTGRRHEVARSDPAAVAGGNAPRARQLVVGGRGDPGAQADVAPEVEPVDDVVQVTLGLRLLREVLAPVPVVEQLPREQVGVRVALRVEPCPRVPVPVPRAPHATAGLDQRRCEPRVTSPVQLIDAGDACADDQHVDVGGEPTRALVGCGFVGCRHAGASCVVCRPRRRSPVGRPARGCTDRLV